LNWQGALVKMHVVGRTRVSGCDRSSDFQRAVPQNAPCRDQQPLPRGCKRLGDRCSPCRGNVRSGLREQRLGLCNALPRDLGGPRARCSGPARQGRGEPKDPGPLKPTSSVSLLGTPPSPPHPSSPKAPCITPQLPHLHGFRPGLQPRMDFLELVNLAGI
jgi:hypothetical protein